MKKMRLFSIFRHLIGVMALGVFSPWACASSSLPIDVEKSLTARQINREQLAVNVVDLDRSETILAWRADKSVVPASSVKIVTTLAALETLGPAFQWKTGFYHDGTIQKGVLKGNLYFVGGGDPRYVAEHLWRDVHTLKAMGIRQITGDIVVDRSLFATSQASAAIDGQNHRSYNLGADAALFNFNSVVIRFIPDERAGIAHVSALPLQTGIQLPKTVPLAAGWCSGWRSQLKADVSNPLKPTFKGTFVKGCGERQLTYVVSDREAYLSRSFSAQMKEAGIVWKGKVKSGLKTAKANMLFESASDDLATTVRLTNKFSNNILARHLFLSLALPQKASGVDYVDARAVMDRWLVDKVGIAPHTIIVDNGSGLSRESQVTAGAMTKVLAYGARSPWSHEWISSFPIAGLDGTMKRRPMLEGSAHMKTGLLSGVKTMAGIVQADSGRRYAVFASLEGKNASQGDAVLDAILHWIASQN